MKEKFLLFFLLIIPLFSFADHIVGGELQFVHKSGNTYTVTLNFYFNDITGSPSAKDPQEYVSIFRKKDNKLLLTKYLPLLSDVQIPDLGGGKCSSVDVKTNLIKYGADVTLNSTEYSDPDGYYISWERCCRNHTINNLQSPDSTGITIYLEFPAVTQNNTSFINSSPVFSDLSNIYGCKGSPFYFDFSATDKDGDSLVYFLKTPLKGHSTAVLTNTMPVGNPAPYDSVLWKSGYDLNHVIHGNPSLEIDPQTGRLLVNPTEAGLFAFAVFCLEYRNGKQIGMVSRDFQFLIQNCTPLFPPVMSMTLPDNSVYQEGDTIAIDMKKQFCYKISVTDSTWDSLKVQEQIALTGTVFGSTGSKQVPNVSVSFDSTDLVINSANPKGKFDLCILTTCINGQYNYAGIYKYRIIASDNSCPVPLLDTLDIVFYLKPIVNHPPVITALPNVPSVDLKVGEAYSLDVFATDKDSTDHMDLYAYGLNASGMTFPEVGGTDSVHSKFSWMPSCDNLKNGLKYKTYFIVKDDHCLNPASDTLSVDFSLSQDTVAFSFKGINLFTPNGDIHNPYFEIPDLPEDNCDNYFLKLEIYDRWGVKVFESDKKAFQWDAAGASDGVYYYVLKYSSKEYQNWVQVVR